VHAETHGHRRLKHQTWGWSFVPFSFVLLALFSLRGWWSSRSGFRFDMNHEIGGVPNFHAKLVFLFPFFIMIQMGVAPCRADEHINEKDVSSGFRGFW